MTVSLAPPWQFFCVDSIQSSPALDANHKCLIYFKMDLLFDQVFVVATTLVDNQCSGSASQNRFL